MYDSLTPLHVQKMYKDKQQLTITDHLFASPARLLLPVMTVSTDWRINKQVHGQRWRMPLRHSVLTDNYRLSQNRSTSACGMYLKICVEWPLIILVLVWR